MIISCESKDGVCSLNFITSCPMSGSKFCILRPSLKLILPERKEELMADLKERTGLNITRVEVRNVDFLRDTANLRIFYFEDEQK